MIQCLFYYKSAVAFARVLFKFITAPVIPPLKIPVVSITIPITRAAERAIIRYLRGNPSTAFLFIKYENNGKT